MTALDTGCPEVVASGSPLDLADDLRRDKQPGSPRRGCLSEDSGLAQLVDALARPAVRDVQHILRCSDRDGWREE